MKARKSVEGKKPKDAAPGENRESWPEEAGGSREPDAHREKPDPPDGPEEKRPARGRLTTGRAVGNSALKGENWPTVKLKDTVPGESRESWPEGRPEDTTLGASRESWPTESRRRESRPCRLSTMEAPETRVSGVFVCGEEFQRDDLAAVAVVAQDITCNIRPAHRPDLCPYRAVLRARRRSCDSPRRQLQLMA